MVDYESRTYDFLLAEYAALRDELVKRIELQHQMLSLGLVALGSLVPLGLQADSPVVLLLYPVIILFLGANWAHNDIRIGQIGLYIRNNLEPAYGWENSAPSGVVIGCLGSLSVFSSRGLYIFTQACVVILCAVVFQNRLRALEIFLMFVDVGVMFLTWFIITKSRHIRLNAAKKISVEHHLYKHAA